MEVVGVEDSEAVEDNFQICSAAIRAAGSSGSPFYFWDWDVMSYWCISACPFTSFHRGDRAAL